MRLLNEKNNLGFLAIPAILIISLLLMIGIYFLDFSISEKKISDSYSISAQAYYLAESGLEYAVFKLKDDETWKTNFETIPNWEISYQGGNVLFPNGYYDIFIKNYDLAKASIIATSTLIINNRKSQRVIKTQIFKAMGESEIGNNVILTDQNLEFYASDADITGSLFSNTDLIAALGTNLDISDLAQATDDIYSILFSTITANEIHAENWNPPAPDEIGIPSVDFDSNDLESWKSQAQALGQVYSTNEFDTMLNNNPNLTLNNIVYITGNINIGDGKHLTVNGVLATNDNITVGTTKEWWQSCPADKGSIIINNIEGQPSGLFSKSQIDFNECSNNIVINGVLYAGNSIDLTALKNSFNINGTMLAREVTFLVIQNGVTLNFDDTIIDNTLIHTEFSPVITVEYWEEEY
ncbi:hypothetical protein ACFL23_01285 [Patescibacteria group bacterium]